MSEWIWYSVICIAAISLCSTVVMVHALSLEGEGKKLNEDKEALSNRREAVAMDRDLEGGLLLKRKSRNNGLNF